MDRLTERPRYVGERFVNNENTNVLESYVTVGLGLVLNGPDGWYARANVQNLTNENALQDAFGGVGGFWHLYGKLDRRLLWSAAIRPERHLRRGKAILAEAGGAAPLCVADQEGLDPILPRVGAFFLSDFFKTTPGRRRAARIRIQR